MGLEPATLYYLRAYATNKLGTGYGAQITFTTSKVGTEQVTDIDGNQYKTVKIGSQIWMAENLKVQHYRNGESITFISDNAQWAQNQYDAMCYYNYDYTNGYTFGGIYNFKAITDSRNICPQGWHIPTYTEWDQLINNLGGSTQAAYKMRLAKSNYWNGYNSDNSSGFSAIPSGCRYGNSFVNLQTSAYYWSSPGSTESDTKYYSIYNGGISSSTGVNAYAMSIRCIKD